MTLVRTLSVPTLASVFALGLAVLAAGPASGQASASPPASQPASPSASQPAGPIATATLAHADGTPAGMARIVMSGGHAMIAIELTGIPAGEHGLHLHMTGQCQGPAFTSAGGHLNPTARAHGMDNPAGSHLGDLPNVTADATGKVSAVIHYGGDPQALAAALFDADGSALVLHAAADDYKTDPSGNSGARIACGVLTRG